MISVFFEFPIKCGRYLTEPTSSWPRQPEQLLVNCVDVEYLALVESCTKTWATLNRGSVHVVRRPHRPWWVCQCLSKTPVPVFL